jgi:hypothetical protein
VTSRRANGEGSIFPTAMGSRLTSESRLRQVRVSASNVYGRTREVVHSRWVELTRKAARGPVVTKVPTVGQWRPRAQLRTSGPSCVQRCTRQSRISM